MAAFGKRQTCAERPPWGPRRACGNGAQLLSAVLRTIPEEVVKGCARLIGIFADDSLGVPDEIRCERVSSLGEARRPGAKDFSCVRQAQSSSGPRSLSAWLHGGSQVSRPEIVTDEQERGCLLIRQCVSKAIAKVEACGIDALAPSAVSIGHMPPHSRYDRRDRKAELIDKAWGAQRERWISEKRFLSSDTFCHLLLLTSRMSLWLARYFAGRRRSSAPCCRRRKWLRPGIGKVTAERS